jgi:hypothetical protein
MTAEDRILLTMKWKAQVIEECATWARANVSDVKRIEDYKAGVAAGWDQCLNAMKLHGMIEI